MSIHRRLLALSKDKEVPRWCKAAIVIGFAITGPFDELIIYPAVVGFMWFRRRHVLVRHGFNGIHVLAGLGTLILLGAIFGVATDVVMGLIP